MSAEPLGSYLDRKQLMLETGFGRAVVDAIFRQLPTTAVPGCRKVHVRRVDVERLLEASTYVDGERVRT